MTSGREYTFQSGNGRDSIYVREWLPEVKPRAALQIAHGLDEHIMRYDEFARFMAENGFLTVGNDHLGHGRSVKGADDFCFFGGKGGWTQVVDDMRALSLSVKKANPGLPYFLLGHSMGSFLTRTFLIRYPKELDGAILSGTGQTPALRVNMGILLSRLEGMRLGMRGRSKILDGMCFGAYNKRFESPATPVDWLTRDTDIIKVRMADELCGHIPTVELFGELLRGIRFIQDKGNLERMDRELPVLFISGEKCAVGNMGEGARAAYRSFLDAGCKNVTIKLYPGARHEVLNETNRGEVYADILAWLEKRLMLR